MSSTATLDTPTDRRTALLGGIAAVAAFTSTALAADEKKENPELENIRALLKAHDAAMKSQDLAGILALMGEKAAVMGTGPGEIWSGKDEIKTAYTHFFQDYDKGEQDFDYQFKIGDIDGDMAWLMASGNIDGKKDGKAFQFPINISVTFTKRSGKWLIASMHFSTLISDAPPEVKAK